MNIRPIKNDNDHETALARISQIMDAKLDSPEGEELEVLATLVDAYESKHHAIEAPDPIEAINFRMEQAGLDRKGIEKAFAQKVENKLVKINWTPILAYPQIYTKDTSIALQISANKRRYNHPYMRNTCRVCTQGSAT